MGKKALAYRFARARLAVGTLVVKAQNSAAGSAVNITWIRCVKVWPEDLTQIPYESHDFRKLGGMGDPATGDSNHDGARRCAGYSAPGDRRTRAPAQHVIPAVGTLAVHAQNLAAASAVTIIWILLPRFGLKLSSSFQELTLPRVGQNVW